MRCLRRIFGITWQDKVPNRVILERAGIFSMYTLLKQRRLCWLGHVVRMADGRRETTAAIQRYLQAGSEGLRNGQMGNFDLWVFSSWPLPI